MPGVHASCPAPSKQAASSALAPSASAAPMGQELQMATGKLIGDARNFALCALGKTEAFALVFLGVRKARIDR